MAIQVQKCDCFKLFPSDIKPFLTKGGVVVAASRSPQVVMAPRSRLEIKSIERGAITLCHVCSWCGKELGSKVFPCEQQTSLML